MPSLLLRAIKFYQRSWPLRRPACRFTPTCSAYTYQAIAKYGTIKGLWLGLRRILRCHPLSKGGADPLK